MMYANYRETELYTVKSGETVSSVAKKFNMSAAELKSLNGLKKNTIKPKKKILVYTRSSKTAPRTESASTYIPSPAPRDTSVKTPPAATPAGKEEARPSASPETQAVRTNKVHTVKSGENLSGIAKKYGCTPAEIVTWNNLKSEKIVAGQKLRVAGGTAAVTEKEKAEPAQKQGKSSSQKYTYYTIQSGDNLWDIAEKNDVTVAQLKAANNLKNNSRLKPGQRIKIPK
jgi:membrane-bound lytic murein transglycosylase D